MGLLFNKLLEMDDRLRNTPNRVGLERTATADKFGIALAWRDYYISYREKHGGYPVRYKNRVLFRDAASYDLGNYAGREYPPPPDPAERAKLIGLYWRLRKLEINAELKKQRDIYNWLASVAADREMPLRRLVPIVLGGVAHRASEEINLEAMRQEILELENEIAECDQNLSNVQTT